MHLHTTTLILTLTLASLLSTAVAQTPVVPLYDATTKQEPATTEDTPDALITRIADRVRDRHAREAQFRAYDHYLSFYWEERTVSMEFVDRVAKGGQEIVVNVTSLAPLNEPNFRCFFRGINTVAEYHHNAIARESAPHEYSVTITRNVAENRELRIGDKMEFEFSPFLLAPKNGRKNYYGTTMLYVIGKGIVPWRAQGERLDSVPLPVAALLGGGTTLPYQYSDEPAERFKQMAANMAPASAQPFMLGRRLHHTNMHDGTHSEKPNPVYEEQIGKLGPAFVASSCIACHVNNGRALPPAVGQPMYQTVTKVAVNATGRPHPVLGTAVQPQSIDGTSETSVQIARYETIEGAYGDGTDYTLRRPLYAFDGERPSHLSVRLTPPLVGLGLLEAIPEEAILSLADSSDSNDDGISGRAQIVTDVETKQPRLGRFGYKAGQPRLRHQIAHAFNSDMGVTTTIANQLDGAKSKKSKTSKNPEVSDADLANLTRYISVLGVGARRNLDDEVTRRGEELFSKANCAACHTPSFTTSQYHPLAELRGQSIQPFTDLLLHDMGKGLADNLGEHRASGSEWRTAPLWNIGLTAGVSGGEAYLHDGRATTLEEAILWHGGEAEQAKEIFRTMPQKDRAALVEFLKSL